MKIAEIWVDRGDLRSSRLVGRDLPPLTDGQILVKIDKFALTANNITYAVAGDMVGYWKFFPAEANWGKIPVWGFGDVVDSTVPGLPAGERLWGFFPMASHVVLEPGSISRGTVVDGAAHRQDLPGLYNRYTRASGEPEALKALEDERCLFFPLFVTSYVLSDYLADNDFFGARQVVITSASSKTGFGLAHLLHHDPAVTQRIIGLTSPQNADFVTGLGIYDRVLGYDGIDSIDASVPTALVDMAGRGDVIAGLHRRLGDNMVESCLVGMTDWESDRQQGTLPGAKPAFFFAPAQIQKRESDWGPGVAIGKANDASVRIAQSVKGQVRVDYLDGATQVRSVLRDLLDNRVSPDRGLMVSLSRAVDEV